MEDRITQREKDILGIAKSIQELAEIFNDMNTLVIDQVLYFALSMAYANVIY
jgi:t-SNARE complex subunit (syntaxin)